MDAPARILVVAGIVLIGVGLLLHAGWPLSFLGRLPGDLRIERAGLRIYIPLSTSLLLSALLSLALWIAARLR